MSANFDFLVLSSICEGQFVSFKAPCVSISCCLFCSSSVFRFGFRFPVRQSKSCASLPCSLMHTVGNKESKGDGGTRTGTKPTSKKSKDSKGSDKSKSGPPSITVDGSVDDSAAKGQSGTAQPLSPGGDAPISPEMAALVGSLGQPARSLPVARVEESFEKFTTKTSSGTTGLLSVLLSVVRVHICNMQSTILSC